MGILVMKMAVLALEIQEVVLCNFTTLPSFLLNLSVLPLVGLVFKLGDFWNRAFLLPFGLGFALVAASGLGVRTRTMLGLVFGLELRLG